MTTTRRPLGRHQPRWTVWRGLPWALLACLAWGTAPGAWAQQAEPIDPVVQQIARLWEKRQRLFRTAIFKAEGKSVLIAGHCSRGEEYKHLHPTPAQDFVYDSKVALYLDFERSRVRTELAMAWCGNLEEGSREPKLRHEIYIWDGAHCIWYVPPEKNPSMYSWEPHVYISDPPPVGVLQMPTEFGMYAAGLLSNRHGIVRADKLRNPPDPGLYRVLGRSKYQDGECVVLRSLPHGSPAHWEELWVDVERDAAIVRHSYYSGSNRRPFWTTETLYRPLAGTWVPREYRLSWLGEDMHLRVTECRVNPELDPHLLRVQVKRGMRIVSSRDGKPSRFEAPHDGDVLQLGPGDGQSAPEDRFRPGYVTWVSLAVLLAIASRVIWSLLARKRR